MQDIQDRHRLKDTEDELLDILLVLDSLHDTIESLFENYTEYIRNPGQLYTRDLDTISGAFQAQIKDIAFSRRNVQSLHAKLQGMNALLSSLLALRNSVSLKQIAQEERKENAIMRRITEKGAVDASAINILTIIILIYLPITVVCVRVPPISYVSPRFT